MAKKLFVGNLSFDLTQDQFKDIFAAYGAIISANIVMDKFSGRSKGFGFVEMPNDSQALVAIESTNEKEIGGRTLKVNEARPREERPRRAPRY